MTWSNGKFLEKGSTVNDDILWIADSNSQTLKKIIASTGQLIIVIGQTNIYGYNDGDAYYVKLNSPSAVVQFKGDYFPKNKTYLSKPVYMKLSSSNKPISSCLYAIYSNYTSCEDSTIEFIDLEGLDLINEQSKNLDVDRKKIKMIPFPVEVFNTANTAYNKKNNINIGNDTANDTEDTGNDQVIKDVNYIFISDTKNHCIRLLNYKTAEVSTYAGVCTEKGFKDGPLGINRLNTPKGIGIDEDGNLFIFDSGNRYIRMIDTLGYMYTLINGACFDYYMDYSESNKFSFDQTRLLCFKNWIKTGGIPVEHIYDEVADLNICRSHFVLCTNVTSNFIYNKTKSLYDISDIYNYTENSVAELFENLSSS